MSVVDVQFSHSPVAACILRWAEYSLSSVSVGAAYFVIACAISKRGTERAKLSFLSSLRWRFDDPLPFWMTSKVRQIFASCHHFIYAILWTINGVNCQCCKGHACSVRGIRYEIVCTKHGLSFLLSMRRARDSAKLRTLILFWPPNVATLYLFSVGQLPLKKLLHSVWQQLWVFFRILNR